MSPPAEERARPAAVHQPVLLRETIAELRLQPGLTVVDGTLGAGGHSREILKHIGPTGRLIGLDRDDAMLARAAQIVRGDNVILAQSSYADLDQVLEQHQIAAVDRILVDLGLSSDQLGDPDRGFGFRTSGELDMRFDRTTGEPAWQLLQDASTQELARIFREYGEERFADAIAEEIGRRRSQQPVRTVDDLTEAVAAAVPGSVQSQSRKHPATRVFQALRIAVNRELEHLQRALTETFYRALQPGGVLAVITFHSLEDRLVKQAFQDDERWENLTPKPIGPRPNEQKINPRSRSAKLRTGSKR